MRRIHWPAAWALALLAAHGAATAAVGADAARELAQKSGLWSQLGSLGTQVRNGLNAAAQKDGGKLDAEQQKRLLTCAEGAYAIDRIRAAAIDAVAGALSEPDLAPLRAWYDSPLGGRITQMEEASSALAVDPQERLRLGAEKLAGAGPARTAALQAILDNTHGSQRMVDTMIEVTLAIQQGVASADPSAAVPPAAEMRAALEQQRPQLAARYERILLSLFSFNYAGLPDDELRRYADFLASASGMAFNDAGARAVSRALRGGGVQLGRCVQEARTTRGS